MKYTLVPVTAADTDLQTVLRNLTKMYCCEWSQYTGMDVDSLGQYAFEKYLPGYWTNADCKAFLLSCTKDDDAAHWAGFALLDKDFTIHKEYDHALAEFFVLPNYRRHGAGRFLATTLFDTFPGKWEVGRNPKNLTAYDFWQHVIEQYTHDHYSLVCAAPEHRYLDGTLGDVFGFVSGT